MIQLLLIFFLVLWVTNATDLEEKKKIRVLMNLFKLRVPLHSSTWVHTSCLLAGRQNFITLFFLVRVSLSLHDYLFFRASLVYMSFILTLRAICAPTHMLRAIGSRVRRRVRP